MAFGDLLANLTRNQVRFSGATDIATHYLTPSSCGHPRWNFSSNWWQMNRKLI